MESVSSLPLGRNDLHSDSICLRYGLDMDLTKVDWSTAWLSSTGNIPKGTLVPEISDKGLSLISDRRYFFDKGDLPFSNALHSVQEGTDGADLGFRFQVLPISVGEFNVSQLPGLQS